MSYAGLRFGQDTIKKKTYIGNMLPKDEYIYIYIYVYIQK